MRMVIDVIEHETGAVEVKIERPPGKVSALELAYTNRIQRLLMEELPKIAEDMGSTTAGFVPMKPENQ